MSDYAVVSKETFDDIQLDAGNILKTFDPSNPAKPATADIIAVTTGGISITCTPTYSDFGEDVDNCPNNTKELKHLDGWNCGMSFTDVRMNADVVGLSLGAQDTTTTAALTTIIPRGDLKQTDFEDAIWWVGPRVGGGGAAVKLKNALSTDGFSLQTKKNGKGQVSMSITGHVSIDDTSVVPMEFYIFDAPGA